MNKSETVGEVAARTGISRTDATSAMDAVFETVTEVLARQEQVGAGAGFGMLATGAREGAATA